MEKGAVGMKKFCIKLARTSGEKKTRYGDNHQTSLKDSDYLELNKTSKTKFQKKYSWEFHTRTVRVKFLTKKLMEGNGNIWYNCNFRMGWNLLKWKKRIEFFYKGNGGLSIIRTR